MVKKVVKNLHATESTATPPLARPRDQKIGRVSQVYNNFTTYSGFHVRREEGDWTTQVFINDDFKITVRREAFYAPKHELKVCLI